MNQFEQLGVDKRIAKRLIEMGIETPTEIQAEALPFLIKKQTDFIGMAQTGTGKTAAYGVPLLHKINSKKPQIQGLILAPTRELVQQIAKELFKFTKYYKPIYSVGIYGGPNLDRQIAMLRKPTQIIVATPGRLMDLLNRKKVDLSQVKYTILDEADEMLKLGFKEDIDFILNYTNTEKNTWLFSATMPVDIQKMIKRHMKVNAHTVQISSKGIMNQNIRHEYIPCDNTEKLNTLLHFLSKITSRGVVFCKTKKSTDLLTKQLISRNYNAQALQGNLTQIERDKVMRAFKNENLRILVSTDVSARGIDVDNLAFVIHYEMPDQTDFYTHRSGRTARGGKRGLSLSLVNEKELKFLKSLSKTLKFELNETAI